MAAKPEVYVSSYWKPPEKDYSGTVEEFLYREFGIKPIIPGETLYEMKLAVDGYLRARKIGIRYELTEKDGVVTFTELSEPWDPDYYEYGW